MLGNPKYSFWWIPKPVITTGLRRSTRAQKGTPTEPYRNVMYDKRVVRGSNYGATSVELDTYNKATEWRRRMVLRKRVLTRNQRNVIGTPPPVMGRRHEVIQTDKYLEDLLDHPPSKTTDTQTELFLEPPPTPPLFISKTGVDVGTAIEPGDLPIQQLSIEDHELPFIDRFIEACITYTAQEVELETEHFRTKGDEISHFTDKNILDGFDVNEAENLECKYGKQQRLTTSHCPTYDRITEEVEQIVDPQKFLMIIIDDIIKQRDGTIAIVNKTSEERR